MDRSHQAVWLVYVMHSCRKYVLAILRMTPLSHRNPTADSAYQAELVIELLDWETRALLLTCADCTASTMASINSLLMALVTGCFHCGLCKSIPRASWRGMASRSGKVYFLLLTRHELRHMRTLSYSMAPQSRLHSALTIVCQVGISAK